MKDFIIALLIFIIILLLIFRPFCSTSYTDSYTNILSGYKLPILGQFPNIQAATLPKMIISNESSSSEEPLNSEEPLGSEEPSRYRKNIKRGSFGTLKMINDSNNNISTPTDENLISRLKNASDSMFIL